MASADCVVAVDVGGTSVKAAVVDARGTANAAVTVPTSRGAEQVADQVAALADELTDAVHARGLAPVALGVVTPGLVDEHSGTVLLAGNLGWRDAPMRALVEKRVDLPVAFGHDVRAGGLAEAVLGAGRDAGDHLFLAIGTGIAGAVMLGGTAYSGGGYAGEIGHIVVEPGGDACACGARGCLEATASARAIARRYALRTGERVAAAEVAARAVAGDVHAVAVWDAAVIGLAEALRVCLCVLAPELIVVGGGLATSGDQLLEPLRARLAERLTFQRVPHVVAAELGERAGCLGAGLLAWHAIGREVRP